MNFLKNKKQVKNLLSPPGPLKIKRKSCLVYNITIVLFNHKKIELKTMKDRKELQKQIVKLWKNFSNDEKFFM